MFSRAHARARGSCSVATMRATPRRASTAASTPVPVPMSKASGQFGGRQRRCGHQVHVLVAHRRKHTVVRVDPAAERRDLDSLLAPLVSADQAQQLAQRGHRGLLFLSRTVSFKASLPHVGCALERHAVVVRQRYEQHSQRARAPGAGLAIAMKHIGHRWRYRGRRGRRGAPRRRSLLTINATRQRLQQQAGILEITLPQQRGSIAGVAIGGVRCHAVVGDDHAPRRRCSALGAPTGGVGLAGHAPADDRILAHGDVFRCLMGTVCLTLMWHSRVFTALGTDHADRFDRRVALAYAVLLGAGPGHAGRDHRRRQRPRRGPCRAARREGEVPGLHRLPGNVREAQARLRLRARPPQRDGRRSALPDREPHSLRDREAVLAARPRRRWTSRAARRPRACSPPCRS